MTAGVAVPDTLAVLGAGSWGTALATLAARNGLATTLWGRDAASRHLSGTAQAASASARSPRST